MDISNKYLDNKPFSLPSYTSKPVCIKDNAEGEESKSRTVKRDRSGNKYSEADFMALPRSQQLELAQTWWMDSKGFDDGKMFQFSYTHFSNLCQKLGFKKGVIDTGVRAFDSRSDANIPADADNIIFIDRGKRVNTVEKKITLSGRTNDKLESLLGNKLSNIEKSKAIDVILENALDDMLSKKQAGTFGIAYRPTELERLV
jgi:hypothetical protein